MKTSEILKTQLKSFEGLLLVATEDVGGVLTIGYGHTGKDVSVGDRISEYGAEELLTRDLEKVESQVNRLFRKTYFCPFRSMIGKVLSFSSAVKAPLLRFRT